MPFRDIIGHSATIAALQIAVGRQRMAHALLFHGEAAIGKRLTADRFAQALSCEQGPPGRTIDPCGICRSCRQIDAKTHPDFFVVEPDPESATPQIKIEQVREIEQQMMYRPLVAERKICIVDDADRMTIGAANALLKTLEEPPDHSLFLLISSRPASLFATIRSRCQALRFATPARTQVEQALVLRRAMPPADARLLAVVSEGRIGEALTGNPKDIRADQREILQLTHLQFLQSTSEILTASEALAKTDRIPHVLSWLLRWIRDLVLLQAGGDPDSVLFTDHIALLEQYAKTANTDALVELLHDIEKTEQQAARHLNLQMALENVLLRLRDAIIGPTPQPA
ncbi:MAG TPA: DNA polymerase III subunit delta' [Nitrospira sp.]|nr:DNA polymerase III subunit delta' [Nitrospira sp.]